MLQSSVVLLFLQYYATVQVAAVITGLTGGVSDWQRSNLHKSLHSSSLTPQPQKGEHRSCGGQNWFLAMVNLEDILEFAG